MEGRALGASLAYCLAFLAFGLEVNLLGPTLPELASRTGSSEEDFGPVFTLTGTQQIGPVAPTAPARRPAALRAAARR
jgi:hypothetical protein